MPSSNTDKSDFGTLILRIRRADGQNPPDTILGAFPTSIFVQSKTWVRTPGFYSGMKKRRTMGFDLPMNDYTTSIHKLSSPKGSIELRSVEAVLPNGDVTYSTTTYEGALSGSPYVGGLYPSFYPVSLPQIDLNALDFQAKSRYLTALKDQKVNLLQAVGERKQTYRLIGNTIDRIRRAIVSLKRGNYAEAARALGRVANTRNVRRFEKSLKKDYAKAVADAWLELQYGWKPLLEDIRGAAEFVAQRVLRESRSRTVKSATFERTESKSVPSVSGSPKIRKTVKRQVTIKYVAYYQSSQAVHQLTQLGLLNIPAVVWELTPFSFVYDWLQPIGTYLSNLDASTGLSWTKGCKVVFEKITIDSQTLPGATPFAKTVGAVVSVGGQATVHEEVINVTRTKLTSWPENELPPFKNPASITHVLNALALLKSNIRVR